MSSKLDPFFNEVFDQLTREGLSYRTVCKFLLGQGVEISPQALRSWYVRRAGKIAKRSGALSPQHANIRRGTKSGIVQPELFVGKEEGGVLAAKPVIAEFRATDGPLKMRIQAEEKKLCTPSLEQSFLLQKKKPDHF